MKDNFETLLKEYRRINTNNRNFDDWFNHVCELYETMSDKDEFFAPDFHDILSPEYQSARFVFDNGSVKILKKLLNDK